MIDVGIMEGEFITALPCKKAKPRQMPGFCFSREQR
jgi:hypothetical protein